LKLKYARQAGAEAELAGAGAEEERSAMAKPKCVAIEEAEAQGFIAKRGLGIDGGGELTRGSVLHSVGARDPVIGFVNLALRQTFTSTPSWIHQDCIVRGRSCVGCRRWMEAG